MTFLIDNQLPQVLAQFFVAQGFKAEHVQDVQLDGASDRAIWDYAVQNQRVIVSKDEDFLSLSLQSDGQAQVVWVRLGNCRKQFLLTAFEKALPQIAQALQQGDRVIELW